jgi:hypothetical protein
LARVGASHVIDERWFADVFYGKPLLTSLATLPSGQMIDVRLNSVVDGISVGDRF